MANIKSAKKRILTTAKKTELNKSRKSEIKTQIKHFEAAIAEKNVDEAQRLIRDIDRNIKQASHRNIMHPNAASRQISSLTKKLNAII